jgi:hypothetical protein
MDAMFLAVVFILFGGWGLGVGGWGLVRLQFSDDDTHLKENHL